MKRWIHISGLTISTLATGAFIAYLIQNLDQGSLSSYVTARTATALTIAVLLCACAPLIGTLAWRSILKGLGHSDSNLRLAAIVLTTQAGKYLPGNVAHHVGRVGLSVSMGIPPSIVATSLAYELALILLTSLIVGGSLATLSPEGRQIISSNIDGIFIVSLVVITLVASVTIAIRYLPRLVTLLLSKRNAMHGNIKTLTTGNLVTVVAINSTAYLLSGLAMYTMSRSLFPEIHVDISLLIAAFSIAWALGFVTPGAPGGIGIREALLVLMLAGTTGPEAASILATALRIATTLGDILCFVSGVAILLGIRKKDSSEPPGENHAA